MGLPHLLLVDDSQAVLTYEQAALSALYGLSTASNGVEALQKARALRPDGILLDLSMPEMDGDAVLAALKADRQLSDVPVIIISSEHARAEACLRAGAAAYLPKPIQAPELRANSRSASRRERLIVTPRGNCREGVVYISFGLRFRVGIVIPASSTETGTSFARARENAALAPR